MESSKFIEKYRKAFGSAELPIAFWYSQDVVEEAPKSKGCFISALTKVREGNLLSFSDKNISCPGGRVFTGFDKPFPQMTFFVSKIEKYKKSLDMVEDYLPNENPLGYEYLNFARIDKIKNLDQAEGLIFFANPDILSGLTTWAFYDSNRDDTVSTIFGSGCSSIITKVREENIRNGHRTFLGMLDPSARKGIDGNLLTYAIPMSRLKTMISTMDQCFLSKSKAWKNIRERGITV